MDSDCSWLRLSALACAAACVVLAGCSGMSEIAGRPFFYKQGPGDTPSEVKDKAGVVMKAPEAAPAAAMPSRQEMARSPAPVAERREPQQTLAQVTPRAPSAAPRAEAYASEVLGGYTQATPYGDLLFISGQIAIDLRSGAFDGGQDMTGQTRQVLENIRTILANSRLTLANVVSTTVYLSNINNFALLDSEYHAFFKGIPPARTVVEVAHLPRGALVEISVIAGR